MMKHAEGRKLIGSTNIELKPLLDKMGRAGTWPRHQMINHVKQKHVILDGSLPFSNGDISFCHRKTTTKRKQNAFVHVNK